VTGARDLAALNVQKNFTHMWEHKFSHPGASNTDVGGNKCNVVDMICDTPRTRAIGVGLARAVRLLLVAGTDTPIKAETVRTTVNMFNSKRLRAKTTESIMLQPVGEVLTRPPPVLPQEELAAELAQVLGFEATRQLFVAVSIRTNRVCPPVCPN
jgi:hypothetical protein